MTPVSTAGGRPLQRPGLKHVVMVTTIGVLLGSAFMATKVALEARGPLTIVAGRVGLAAVLVGAALALRRPSMPRGTQVWGLLAGIALLNTAIPYFLVTWAVQHIDTGLVAILGGTGPLIGLLLSHVMTRDDRLTAAKGAGLLLGFAGVLIATGGTSAARMGTHVLASLAGVGMAASFALGGVLARRLASLAPDVVTAAVLGVGAAVMISVAVAVQESWRAPMAWRHVAAIGYLGAMATALPYVIRFRLIRQVGYTFTSFSGYVVPSVGVLFGAIFLHESITPSMLGALALVLLGLWVIRIGPARGGNLEAGLATSPAPAVDTAGSSARSH